MPYVFLVKLSYFSKLAYSFPEKIKNSILYHFPDLFHHPIRIKSKNTSFSVLRLLPKVSVLSLCENLSFILILAASW